MKEFKTSLDSFIGGWYIDEKICDDIDNILVEECKSERELIKAWQSCINRFNPDIITGYNIFGFDFKYIGDRCTQLDLVLNNLGRLNTDSENYDKHYNKLCKLKNMNFSKKGDGDAFNNPYYMNMDGRVIFDVQKEIDDHNNVITDIAVIPTSSTAKPTVTVTAME